MRLLDLDVAAGECVAVVGRNGSGKTTAVRLIAGLLEPSAGVVEIEGANVHCEPDAVRARASVAVMLDTPLLYDDLSVGEHLELVAVAHGVAGEGLDERIDALLDGLGLAGRRDSRPGELSRGMRQKLSLACALVRPFDLLVLDEPVVGLDPGSQGMLREVLLGCKRIGAAVLLTTHQLAFARGVADRAVLLADGVMVAQGPYERIVDQLAVEEGGLWRCQRRS